MIGEIKWGIVTLEMTKVNELRRDVVFSADGSDYLFTQVYLNTTCVLNPAATSFLDLSGTVPNQGAGAFAGRTDRILFDYLSQPRRTLTVWVYDADGSKRVYLESPPQGAGGIGGLPSDAKSGPICKVFGIHGADVHGVRTWILNLEFMTWINNCLDGSSPVLSHRWEKNVDYDAKYRAIITTRGKVVFHAGRLFAAGISPDYFRDQFFQGPPPGFAVAHVSVDIASNGAEADYTQICEERFYSLGQNSPAVTLEAQVTTGYSQGAVLPALAKSTRSLFPSSMSPIDIVQWAWNGAGTSAVAANLQTQLPVYWASINVRAHGARESARVDLHRLCLAVAFARLGAPNWFGLANRTTLTSAQNLHDNYVELDMKLSWTEEKWVQLSGAFGPIGSIAATFGLSLFGTGRGLDFVNSFFTANSALPTATNLLGNDTTIPVNMLQAAGANKLLNTAGAQNAGKLQLLTQNGAVGNRPMYGVDPTVAHPDVTRVQNSRTAGYTKYILTQALMGQCYVPPMPGTQDAPITDFLQPTPTVPAVPTMLLPPG